MRPDLFLTTEDGSLIADTKYKIVYTDPSDPKKGIAQNDLYQMIAYAIRFEVEEAILFYPNTVHRKQEIVVPLIIKDSLAGGKEIRIRSFQLPIFSQELLSTAFDPNMILGELFEPLRVVLKENLKRIFGN